MKKYVIMILIASAILISCKKDKAAAEVAGKDYSISIKDKTWWGELTNAGETVQYYSVHFNADNTILWSQLSDDYKGTWSLDKNKLTLNFTNPAVIVNADISEDNKLANITTNTANKVNIGEMVTNPNIVLENTVWSGLYSVPGNSTTLQLSFLAGPSVIVKGGNNSNQAVSYKRGLSGGYIRFKSFYGGNVFGVITASGEMKGSFSNYKKYWSITKQ